MKRFFKLALVCCVVISCVATSSLAVVSYAVTANKVTTTTTENNKTTQKPVVTTESNTATTQKPTTTQKPATTQKPTTSTNSTTTATTEPLKGDVNKDGEVTADDAKVVLRIAAGQASKTALADVNSDGIVSVDDVKLTLELSTKPMTDDEYIEYLMEIGFTRSYTDYLLKLHKKYPEWEFVPFITNLTWEEAVEGEHTPHNKQLIENIVSSDFKCSCNSCRGVIQEASNWVSASKEAVEYYLDPRNFLTEEYIFQFETTAYDESHTIKAVESILKNTWMYDSPIKYHDAYGNIKTYKKDGVAVKYSEAIMRAARESGMSAYFLASKIVQEVGAGKSSYAGGSCGTNSPYNGIYNYYNIGAYTGAGDGLRWANGYMKSKAETKMYSKASAKSSKVVTVPKGKELNYIGKIEKFYKASVNINGKKYIGYIPVENVSISTTFGRPWNSPYRSIYYGAKYIYTSFSENQFTGYLQKFNVNPNSENLYTHEYMANIRAAAAESQKTYKAYNESGVLENKKIFSIPVFLEMPNADYSAEQTFKKTKPVVSCEATKTAVTLSWKPIKNAEYYQVWKYDAETKKYKRVKVTSATSYKETGFKSGASAKYKVRAYFVDSIDEVIYTAFSDVFVACTAPSAPTGLSVVSTSETKVKIKWGAVSSEGYKVYRYNNITGYEFAGTTTETVFVDSGLSKGSTYQYKVCAFYETQSMQACSEFTPLVSAKTKGTPPKTGTVTVNGVLNIRKSPTTSSDVIITAANGQVVAILGKTDNWYKVQFAVNGTSYIGYAHMDYIRVTTTSTATSSAVSCKYAEPSVLLSKGDSGEGVKWLQWHLWKAGYMKESDVKGNFGPATDAAVKAFQKDHNLDVDGLVGAATRTALKNAC